MDERILDKVCKEIYQRYPGLRGCQPKVSKQAEERYLLVFLGSQKTPDGKTIRQLIRVVVSEDGRIIKTSMSR